MQKFRTQRQQHIERLRKCNIEIVASELFDEISDSDTASIDDKCSDRSLRTEMCIVVEDTTSSDETFDQDSYENTMLALMDAIELELSSIRNENLANEHHTYNFGFGDAGVPEIDEGDSLLCPVCRYIVDTYVQRTYRIISSYKLSLICCINRIHYAHVNTSGVISCHCGLCFDFTMFGSLNELKSILAKTFDRSISFIFAF
jgi:hypothetical protein